jgi:minor extracellular serine protease Vpr
MRLRAMTAVLAVLAVVAALLAGPAALGAQKRFSDRRQAGRQERNLPHGFVPAVAAQSRLGRYFVVMKGASLAQRVTSADRRGQTLSRSAQRSTTAAVRQSQQAAVGEAEARGGRVVFRYSRLVNAFSARLSPRAAAALVKRPDVKSVQPVAVVRKANETSVPFIGATEVWEDLGVRGQGMRVAVVDTGIDYTHADFGGPGTVQAYENNDPTFVEQGTFPTNKVIGGYDFVGEDYDVLDDDPANDAPRPDFDPLDFDGHGTHTAGTCCGNGVQGEVGPGVAPRSKLYAMRVWDVGNSTDDVLVAAYERAMDPNQDGDIRDAVDVLSFSGGVTYGTLNSVEATAAQRVVDLGTVFVASAGNEGNQPAGGAAYRVGTPASARGVVAVAASIDQFVAQTLTVNDPPGLELPDKGVTVHQDWSADITADITADVVDGREFFPPDDPNGVPDAEDRQFCDTTPPGSPLAGKIALVFKGSTGEGDCDGSEKVFRAQEAGAIAVILWSGFGGAPFGLAPGLFADEITIPAVMVSGTDAAVLGQAISPDAPASYNTGTLNVTINFETSIIPGFEDRMTDFTSEGPARLTNDLKPDISAPGADINSAAAGTGTEGTLLSGTSMAAPHVSGVATLLRQIHPRWGPGRIKAVMMNQAKTALANNDGSTPVPATVMGAGRVRADQSATATSVASPGSLSYGLRFASKARTLVRSFNVKNLDDTAHTYDLRANTRYADFDPGVAQAEVSVAGSGAYGPTASFTLQPGDTQTVRVQLTLDPALISEAEQEFGWYFFHPNIDGIVRVRQSGGGDRDRFHVSWHVAPLNASKNHAEPEALDLTGGPATLAIENEGTGISHADAYLLGAEDEVDSFGEEDITHVGARSFTGETIGDDPEGVPAEVDALAGLSWIEFLTNTSVPTEPIEFGVRTSGVHNTTESLEVDVAIDAGADGEFEDPVLQADFLAVKLPGGGETCLFDLSLDDPFAACAQLYFPDYSNFNTNVTGVVVDAGDIGLTDTNSEIAYSVTACTGTFSGDVPGQFCDTAGSFDDVAGTHSARLDATDPALDINPLVCGGFWGDPSCNEITVSQGSAAADDNPSVLMLYPNNPRRSTAQVITTSIPTTLSAELNGQNEISPEGDPGAGDPDGTGTATVNVASDSQSGRLCFAISAADIELPAAAAHIHAGPAGVNGDIVVPLTPPGADGTSSGCVEDVSPALLTAIKADPADYYVNVHTSDFPAGAIRGQLQG